MELFSSESRTIYIIQYFGQGKFVRQVKLREIPRHVYHKLLFNTEKRYIKTTATISHNVHQQQKRRMMCF